MKKRRKMDFEFAQVLKALLQKMKTYSLLFALLIAFSSLSQAKQLLADYSRPEQDAGAGYTPKYKGDPARSDSEFAALAYMRVVIRAQQQFNKHYGHYATNLTELVHSGTFTKRMVNPDRGDYTVGFKGKKDSYVLTMTPNHMDADHRSFYAEDDGKIHADDSRPANDDSPVVR